MEIERKFLIDRFPEGTPAETMWMEQGYLSWEPVVRIRSRKSERREDYILCVKGRGTLVRTEVELPMTKSQYEELKGLLQAPPALKEQRVYPLEGGLTLECNCVNGGTELEFWYAEVEFPSVEAANAFLPPDYLGPELTEYKGYTMSAYCRDAKALLAKLEEIKKQQK